MGVDAQPASPRIGASTRIGTVRLTVRDLERARRFYEQQLGLVPREQPDGTLLLVDGGSGSTALLELRADPTAPARDPGQTGLFHVAILVPSRRALAVSLARLAEGRWPLNGASDHLVSEALYLSDPDGNGIEVYRDRARAEWGHDPGGQLQMASLPLDLDSLLAELKESPPDPVLDGHVPAGTRIGHIHLQVAELSDIEAFYSGVLGFDVMVRAYPGALFLAAGGYHHHLGLNTWNSRGGGAPAPGAIGLRSFEVMLQDQSALDEALWRVDAAGLATEPGPVGTTVVRDPSGNAVVLTAARSYER